MAKKQKITEKQFLRARFKKVRDRLSWPARKSASGKIARAFLKLLKKFPRVKTIGVYIHAGSEVNTVNLLEKLIKAGNRVAAPKVNPQNRSLRFLTLKRGLIDCRLGPYNILEPYSYCPAVENHTLDLVIVPGISFDLQGYRLGYGQGYYDRFLKKVQSAVTVGFAYEKSIARELPKDENDVPVQYVITEKKIRKIT